MKTQNLILFIISGLIAFSCKSVYDYKISGKLLYNEEEIDSELIEYQFLSNKINDQYSEFDSNGVVFSDSNGVFTIHNLNSPILFDNIKIDLNIYPYKSQTLTIEPSQWNLNGMFSNQNIAYEFNPIQLIKEDRSKHCQIGKNDAQADFKNGNHIHQEYAKMGTFKVGYWENYERRLNDMGITLEVIHLANYINVANRMRHECYYEEMKNLLKLQYGDNWYDQFR